MVYNEIELYVGRMAGCVIVGNEIELDMPIGRKAGCVSVCNEDMGSVSV